MHQANVLQQLQHAIRLFHQGQVDQAEQLGRALLAQLPGHPDALNLVGQIEQHRGRTARARRLASRSYPRLADSWCRSVTWGKRRLR